MFLYKQDWSVQPLQTLFIPTCVCVLEETVKAVGPIYVESVVYVVNN